MSNFSDSSFFEVIVAYDCSGVQIDRLIDRLTDLYVPACLEGSEHKHKAEAQDDDV